MVRRLHFRRIAADVGARNEGAAAVPRENLFPAQRGAERARQQREVRRGIPRGDASTDEDLRCDRHAGEVGSERIVECREDIEGLDEGPMKTVRPAGRGDA